MSDNLHLDTLPVVQQQLFEVLSVHPFIQDFYLAGGTCLALHFGHRKSLDFDFFTPSDQYHHLKSLVYFADAEIEAMPVMIKPLRWDNVKRHIISCARRFQI